MYKIKCPNCKGSVEFEVREGLEDAGNTSKELTLYLHGKKVDCPSCGAIVRLKRGTRAVTFYTLTAEYTVPVYDKSGKRVAILKPSEIKERVEVKVANGR